MARIIGRYCWRNHHGAVRVWYGERERPEVQDLGRRHSPEKTALRFRHQLNPLMLAISLWATGLLPVPAHSQTVSGINQQEAPPAAKARIVYAPRTAAADPAQLPDLSSLDIPALICDSDRLGTAMHLRLPEYTYLQTRLSRELNQRGKLVEHVGVYEAYPIKVRSAERHVVSLISEDGVPISPKRLKKERQSAIKAMEAAEQSSAQQASDELDARSEKYVTAGIGVNDFGEGVWVGVSQFLRQCRFGEPRYERIVGREMIALNIQSCTGNPGAPGEQYLARMTGVVWIDTADKVVARLEAWPAPRIEQSLETSLAPPDDETLVYEQMRLPGGLWVPKRIRLNALGKAALFNGTDKDMTFEFSRYQHFGTDVKDLQSVTLKP
jgi:hypothetical protein